MLYLLLAAAAMIVGCFCVVFGLDKNQPAKTRRKLLYIALICVFLVWGLVMLIMMNPMR